MALGALFAALALFWISTRQLALLWRLLIWVAGAALLAFAASTSIAHPDEFGLVSALIHLPGEERESAIIRAIKLNGSSVAPFLLQLSDFFLAAGALLAILALLSFSKGEQLERFVRPMLIALIAFIGGSVATLAVVAIGFGGYTRPRTFTINEQNVSRIAVHDGDTFRIGDYSLRLYGIDAPESGQVCGGEHLQCGDAAREWLEGHLTSGVQCDQTLSRNHRPRDALGRALVRCFVPSENGLVDLSEMMVREGYAVQYLGDDCGYTEAEAAARQARAGLMGGCSLRPDAWRHNADPTDVTRVAPTMGDCSSAQPPRRPGTLPQLPRGEDGSH
jgi:endonuclease YncB( thermonuclease family)